MSAADLHDGLSEAESIAARFVDARLNRHATPDYPGQVPQDMASAYAIQDVAIELYPDAIVGWKVGMVPPQQQERLKTHRLAGPIFANNVWTASDQPIDLPVIPGGFAAIEAEFVARVGAVDPDKTDWTLEEAVAAVETLHIGIELAASPLPTINELGSAVVASDFGNNGGLVLGPAIEDWQARLDGIEVQTTLDGVVVGTAAASAIPMGILESVRFLIEHCSRRGRPVSAGTLISTGAVTGVHQAAIGSGGVCTFSGVGAIPCRVVQATV